MTREKRRVIIMGAGGRDFCDFNILFKDDDGYDVRAFTAAQLPGLGERTLPPELSGPNYPKGIPIHPEERLPALIKEQDVDEVILAYSDMTFGEVLEKANWVLRSGADFRLLDPWDTMVESKRPVIAVCAVRTGAGKSSVTRKTCAILREDGYSPVAIRHPMPYGDLAMQVCQRFSSFEDLKTHNCTVEEREEYEPLLERGITVYSGIDMARVVREAESEADVVVFDGGNNDTPLVKPDLLVVVADPLRAGQELVAYPGTLNVHLADVIVINKVDAARPEEVQTVRENARRVNNRAIIVETVSEVEVDDPSLIEGRSVLVLEDGPTVTHGGLPHGAGLIAARKYGAKRIIDPRPYAVGEVERAYHRYAHLANVVPTVGYNERQVRDLEETLNNAKCDAIVVGAPIDLRRFMEVKKPMARVRYEIKDVGSPVFTDVIKGFEPRIK